MENRRQITFEDLEKEIIEKQGLKNFPKDFAKVVSVCPRCKTLQTGQDLINAGAGENLHDIEGYLFYSCLGRFDETKGCNWTLGGLFQIHNLELVYTNGEVRPIFQIADKKLTEKYWSEKTK